MAFLTEASPEQVKIWCLSHNLNLCIQDTTKSVNESSIFTDLNACATIIKASHKRMDIWKEEVPGNRRLGKIGETRRWSKHDVLGKVFGKYGQPSSSLFVSLIITLERILDLDSVEGSTKQSVVSIKERLLKFKTVLSAHLFLRIFEITTPLSKYLQTKGLDILKSHQMVMKTISSLEKISRDFHDVKRKSTFFAQLENEHLDKTRGMRQMKL